ncbi:MAG: hypothetical protein C5B49_06200, partial [Bdellovibrio sp.]
AAGAAAAGAGRNPASLEGSFKDHHGDKIGVSVDSVFEMMHRRYRFEASQNKFFGGSGHSEMVSNQ